ncbi:MAG: PEP-CTERM sorting domain-containing protein [Candidatus Brocadiaceae bacterium]|nr:PEP-CTERM sorting domain-containing protein [Candidatus Brocadiaceae bacterium]
MKKLMLGMFILLFVVAVSCVGGVKKAEALSMISGSVGFTGTITTDTGDVLTATELSFISVDVDSVSGDYVDFVAPQVVTFVDLDFGAFSPLTPLWTMTDIGTGKVASFNLDTVSSQTLPAGILAITGTGTLMITNGVDDLFESTNAIFTLTTQNVGGIPTGNGIEFTFSAGTAAVVPEPGTVALLGIGLAGLVGVGARRRAKKKAS